MYIKRPAGNAFVGAVYPGKETWSIQNNFQSHFYLDEVPKLQKNSAYVLPANNAASVPAKSF